MTITVYARPGCVFCWRLRRGLDRAGVAYTTIDIRHDGDAAAFVREANRGDELVPTVAVGDRVLRNPSTRQVLATARELAPAHAPAAPARRGRRRHRPGRAAGEA